MHSTRLCKNILIVLLAFSALFGVVACSNLSGGDAPTNSAIQPANGVGVVRGTINSNQSAARTALPTTPTANKYKITATASGFATVEKEFNTTDFELALPYNGSTTWTLKASALDATNAEVMSGTVTVTLNDTTPTATQDINVAYSQTGTGSVDLNISWAASVQNVKYELVRGSTKITDTATTSPLTISQTNLAAGAYSLAVEFYGAGGSLLYRVDETVNVYANLKTTQFEGNAPYISGGGISVDQDLLDNFKISTIYVGGRGLISNVAASDSNDGSQFAPLATLKKAVEKANVTGAGIENIIVQGDTTEAVFPDWAEVKYTGATALTITGKGANRSTTVAVNGNLVIQGDVTINNLTLVGTEVQVENSGVLTISEATLKDHTGWGSGGIKVVDSGKATVTNCTIKDNQVINDPNANPVWGGTGGGLYIDTTRTVEVKDCIIQNNNAQRFGGAIYIRSAQNVTLENCTISGNTAGDSCPGIYNAGNLTLKGTQTFGADQDIYLAQKAGASPAAVHTITLGGDIDISAGSKIKITPQITTAGTEILTANTAALITDNMNKFTLAEDLALKASGTTAVIANAVAKISPVYLDAASGDDANDGAETTPVATLKHALEILDTTDTNPRIIVASEYTLASGEANLLNRAGATGNKVTIERGTATGNVMKITSGTVTIKNVIFDGKKDDFTADGSLLYITGSSTKVTIGDGAILKDNNNNYYPSGAIYNEGMLTISGGTIIGNQANSGGGIYNVYGTVTISGGEISGNTASGSYGGGIYNEGTLIISDGTISSNTAEEGGGIGNINGTVEISDGTISSNTAEYGGGIYNYGSGTVKISGGTISSNTANYNGGGIYNNGTLEMSGAAQIADDNDVWLYSDKFITVTGALSATGTVANITLRSSTQYEAGTQVLDLTAITAAANKTAVCGKFKLLNPDGTENADFVIKPDSADTTKGVLADATAKLATVYLNGLTSSPTGAPIGSDANDGSTAAKAVATLKHALEILDTDDANPTIVVVANTYSLKTNETLDFSDTTAYPYPNKITIKRDKDFGGDLISITGTHDIKNVIIDGNKAEKSASGALLKISGAGTVTIGDGAELINNSNSNTSGNAGAILCSGNTNINRKLIIEGTALIRGNNGYAAIYNTLNSTLEIKGGTIEENSGGAIYNTISSTVTISGGSIINNTRSSGGAIMNAEGTVTISGGTISGNTATGNGGAISNSSKLTITGGTISGNTANGNGNAIYNSSSYFWISGAAQIADNNDVYLSSTSNCIIINNSLDPPDPTKPVAVITPYRYTNGDQILKSTSGKISEDVCKMFAITPDSSATPATEWVVVVASNEVRGNLELASKFETVYLNGTTGNDTKFGDTEANAVKTLAKALYRLDTKAANPTIVVLKEYSLATGETLDFSDATTYLKPVTIKRGTASGNVIKITTSGEVILDNVILDGNCVPGGIDATSSTGALLSIGSSGKVTINETTPGTTILKNNENKSSGGGAIYNEGTLKINGGTITSNSSSNNGGGIYNKGTLTINGGTISDNTANKGGGIFAYGGKTTISNGSNINIIDNIANNNGGGICNNLYNSEVEINGGNISGNTAGNNGGGVSNAGIITFTGGTISGNMLNGSGSGKDIYNNATMQMSGTVIADEVYLNRGKYITVTGAFSHAATIKAAKIVLNNSTTPSQYAAGTQVLAAGGTLSEITPGICDKFVLLDKDDPTIASTEFNIVPNPADTTQGILAAAQGSGGIILALADTYNISFTGLTSGTIQRGSTLSFTVTNSSGTEPTATYTTVIKQNGTEFKSSATNSIVIPSTLPAGVYDIYITITVGSNTYDYTKQITVTI